jgi:hypothetical protein
LYVHLDKIEEVEVANSVKRQETKTIEFKIDDVYDSLFVDIVDLVLVVAG